MWDGNFSFYHFFVVLKNGVFYEMVILVVFNSFNVVKNLEKPAPVCAKRPHITLLRIPEIRIFQESVEVKKKNFFVSESHLYWACSGMARHIQINSKVYIRNILEIRIWSSFICILNPHNRGFYENQCRLLVYHCFGQSVQHFS